MDEVTQQVEESRRAIEAIEPSGHPDRVLSFKGWMMPDGRQLEEKVYTQAPLGMFPVQEFGTITTEILNGFVQGDMGIKLGELFRGEVAMPTEFTGDAVDRVVSDNLELIKAFIQLVQIVPEYQLDIMALSLGVPRKERAWFKECIVEPPHRGGLTIEEGFDILIWFIRQNASMIRNVVSGKARELVDVFQVEALGQTPGSSTEEKETPEEESSSPGGTPSSISSPDTPVSV